MQNLYIWPHYTDSVRQDLSEFAEGADFADWNLGDIYDKVPCDFAAKMGVRYGIFANSGTAGLHASLIALGLKPGDEVIVPAMTFIRSATPLNHLGLQPVIADIDAETGNVSPESILQNITRKTRAVVVVHMWGVPADLGEIRAICDKHKIFMVEDFSHAHFSKYRDKFVGSFGDVSFASLQRKKTISAGEGGIIVTNQEDLYKKLQEITSPGSFVDQSNYTAVDFSGFGLNMRMNPFAAVVVKNFLRVGEIENIISDRNVAIANLAKILSRHPNKFELVQLPGYTEFGDISWYSYKFRSKVPLDKLHRTKLWKFSDFGYAPIADHQYWKKDANYYPFCLNISPRVDHDLKGMCEYMKNRVTLNVPTVSADYWTEEKVDKWIEDLREAAHSS